MKQRNKDKRLDGRRKDFDRGTQSRESKVQGRWESGGYHRPGSHQR